MFRAYEEKVSGSVIMIMRKLGDLEKIAEQIYDYEDLQEKEETNELESDTNSDSGLKPDDSESPDDNTSSERMVMRK